MGSPAFPHGRVAPGHHHRVPRSDSPSTGHRYGSSELGSLVYLSCIFRILPHARNVVNSPRWLVKISTSALQPHAAPRCCGHPPAGWDMQGLSQEPPSSSPPVHHPTPAQGWCGQSLPRGLAVLATYQKMSQCTQLQNAKGNMFC